MHEPLTMMSPLCQLVWIWNHWPHLFRLTTLQLNGMFLGSEDCFIKNIAVCCSACCWWWTALLCFKDLGCQKLLGAVSGDEASIGCDLWMSYLLWNLSWYWSSYCQSVSMWFHFWGQSTQCYLHCFSLTTSSRYPHVCCTRYQLASAFL